MSSFEPTSSGDAPRAFVPEDPQPRARHFVASEASDAAPRVLEPSEAPEPAAIDPAAVERQAYDEGLRAGRESLPWREAAELETALDALRGAAAAVRDLQRDYLAQHRRLAVELSLTIAECVVGRVVDSDPEALTGLVERAIAAFADAEPLCVKLSARDHEVIQASPSAALSDLAESHGLRFEADGELEGGEVRVDGDRSRVDARWTELLRRVREELLAPLASEVPAS